MLSLAQIITDMIKYIVKLATTNIFNSAIPQRTIKEGGIKL